MSMFQPFEKVAPQYVWDFYRRNLIKKIALQEIIRYERLFERLTGSPSEKFLNAIQVLTNEI